MPVLQSSDSVEDRKQFDLPSTTGLADEDRAWVVMDVSPLIALDTINVAVGDNQTQVAAAILERRIKDWNFTEVSGEKAAITKHTICRMTVEDVAFLNQQISTGQDKELTEEQKKTSSDTLAQPLTETQATSPVTPYQ